MKKAVFPTKPEIKFGHMNYQVSVVTEIQRHGQRKLMNPQSFCNGPHSGKEPRDWEENKSKRTPPNPKQTGQGQRVIGDVTQRLK